MNKNILTTTLLLTITLSTCALADVPVCSPSERPWGTNSRFFDTAIGSVDGRTPAHFFDLETIKIDKKNKVIKAWIISEASEKGRSSYTTQVNGFSNYGYTKMLWTIDYANIRLKSTPAILMNCDGSLIVTLEDDEKWEEIFPTSVNEMVVKKIMTKYNLK